MKRDFSFKTWLEDLVAPTQPTQKKQLSPSEKNASVQVVTQMNQKLQQGASKTAAMMAAKKAAGQVATSAAMSGDKDAIKAAVDAVPEDAEDVDSAGPKMMKKKMKKK